MRDVIMAEFVAEHGRPLAPPSRRVRAARSWALAERARVMTDKLIATVVPRTISRITLPHLAASRGGQDCGDAGAAAGNGW